MRGRQPRAGLALQEPKFQNWLHLKQGATMASPTQQAQQKFRQAHMHFAQVFANENDQAHEVADGIREG